MRRHYRNPDEGRGDEELRRLERAVAEGGGRAERVRLATARLRRGDTPERPLRAALAVADQATLRVAEHLGVSIEAERAHMELPFEALRELVAIVAGDPRPRIVAHAHMRGRVAPGRHSSSGMSGSVGIPVTMALAVRDEARNSVVVGIAPSGSRYGAPEHPNIGRVSGWWASNEQRLIENIARSQHFKRVWATPEIVTTAETKIGNAKKATSVFLAWARRAPREALSVLPERVEIDLVDAELWSKRTADEATTDERLWIAQELWRAWVPLSDEVSHDEWEAAVDRELTGALPRVARFGRAYAENFWQMIREGDEEEPTLDSLAISLWPDDERAFLVGLLQRVVREGPTPDPTNLRFFTVAFVHDALREALAGTDLSPVGREFAERMLTRLGWRL